MENLDAKAFTAQLHTEFRVQLPDSQLLLLQLYEVTERNQSPQIEQFSLLFRGPLTPQRGQGMHSLQHDEFGTIDLFLVPIGPDAQGMRYQAVFNRFRDGAK